MAKTAQASAAPATGMSMLDQLLSDQEQALGRIQERRDTFTAFDVEPPRAASKEEVKFDAEKVRRRVLTSTIEEERVAADRETKDIGIAVHALETTVEQYLGKLETLGQISEDDKQAIADAEQRVKDAERGLAEAQSAWFRRDSKMEAAKAAIAQTKEDVKSLAEQAAVNARERLRTADIETVLRHFDLRGENTKTILVTGRESIRKHVELVVSEKEAAYAARQKAAQAHDKFKEDLVTVTAELGEAQQHLDTLERDTSEYAAQAKKVADLRARQEDLAAKVNTAFALLQKETENCARVDAHETTQRRLYQSFTVWIGVLESNLRTQKVQFRSWLEAIKASSVQEIAKKVVDVGAEIARRSTESMVAIGEASERAVVTLLGAHPRTMEELRALMAARDAAHAAVRAQLQALEEEFKQKYDNDGDPLPPEVA